MSVKVRTDPKKIREWKFNGTVIKYHFIEFLDLQRMATRHLIKGFLPKEKQETMAIEAMAMMIVGWSGFINEETEKPLRYNPKHIRSLPSMLLLKFFNEVLNPEFKYHGFEVKKMELKNSEPTSEF